MVYAGRDLDFRANERGSRPFDLVVDPPLRRDIRPGLAQETLAANDASTTRITGAPPPPRT
jgi:hypothetical protein